MSLCTPTRRPASGAQTCGRMGCVKHRDILQTPVSEGGRTLAVIVMVRFRAAESAGLRSIICTRVCGMNTRTFTVVHPLSQLSEEQQPTHQEKWLSQRPMSRHVFLCGSASCSVKFSKMILLQTIKKHPSG